MLPDILKTRRLYIIYQIDGVSNFKAIKPPSRQATILDVKMCSQAHEGLIYHSKLVDADFYMLEKFFQS